MICKRPSYVLGVENRVDLVFTILRHTLKHRDILLVEVDKVDSELAALVLILITQLLVQL